LRFSSTKQEKRKIVSTMVFQCEHELRKTFKKFCFLFVPYEKIPCLALKKFTQNKTTPQKKKNLPVTEFSPFHSLQSMGPSKNRIKTLGSQQEDALVLNWSLRVFIDLWNSHAGRYVFSYSVFKERTTGED